LIGYYRVKADLDLLIWIVLPYLIIAESTELQKTIAKLVLTEGKTTDSVKTLVNILSAELKANLDVAQYGLGSEDWRHDAKP
jgi:hypothetical protein